MWKQDGCCRPQGFEYEVQSSLDSVTVKTCVIIIGQVQQHALTLAAVIAAQHSDSRGKFLSFTEQIPFLWDHPATTRNGFAGHVGPHIHVTHLKVVGGRLLGCSGINDDGIGDEARCQVTRQVLQVCWLRIPARTERSRLHLRGCWATNEPSCQNCQGSLCWPTVSMRCQRCNRNSNI